MKALQYRPAKAMIFFATSISFLLYAYYMPYSGKFFNKLLKSGEGLTVFGWFSIVTLLLLSTFFLLHVIQAIFGIPAVRHDGKTLLVNSFPRRKVAIEKIRDIQVYENYFLILIDGESDLKVNTVLLKFDVSFCKELMSIVGSRNAI